MKRSWLWLIVPWTLFVAAALGWVAYWHVVAGEAEKRLNAFVAAQQAQGAEASIGRIERRGFPMLLHLEIHDIAFAPARGGWRLQTSQADLHIGLLDTEHLILDLKTPIAISRDDGATTTLGADSLIASLRTRDGALAVAGVEADNLHLDDPAKDGVLLARKVVINVRPDPRTADDYQVAFDAQGMVLPRHVRSFESFGLDVGVLRAAVVITHGAALAQGAQNDPLGPWREAGGRLRFEGLTLQWGPLEADGHGEGGLDAERRIEGELEIPIERPGPVLTAIANGPEVDRDAKRALALLAAGYAISGEDITLDVEAREGRMRLEGLPVRTLPPVY